MILVGSEFSREEYHARLKWLIRGRVALAAFLMSSLILFQYRYRIYHFPTVYLFYFACAVTVLTGIYWYLLGQFNNLLVLAYVQIGGDILLISWLVYLTGGIDSGFSILYHVTIISASIILYRRGGLFSASLASILYGTMLDMQYYNILGFIRSQNFTPFQVLYLLFINILSFYTVALLSSYLSERLRKTRLELREKSMNFDDLQVLQDHILRSVGSGIVTMNMTGEVTSWNNGAEQITGYSFEQIRGSWKNVFGDSIKGLFGQTDKLKERPVRFEGRILKRNGSKAILGFTATILKDDRDDVRGIILTFQDITRLIEMEEQMRRQERLATVGSLAAGIAHEIRNPLASLRGSIQMLQGELDLKGENRHLMDIVLRETDRLNTIITEFLEYARTKTLHRQKVNLASIVNETIALFRNSKNSREGVRVSSHIAPTIAVIGDSQRLRQVFWNLLINAGQAITDRGEITIAAEPGSGVDEEDAVIRFTDTGEGIAAEHLDNIFDPFFTTKTDGTGLGLAIVYRIIEDHRGSINVRSEPGEGTTFTIKLPFEEVVEPGVPLAGPPLFHHERTDP
jgi:two-component system sensor histidine kinase PilS (NtrC family)